MIFLQKVMVFEAQIVCLSSETISFWVIPDRSTEE